MLATESRQPRPKVIYMFKRLKPLNCEIFTSFLLMVDNSIPLINTRESEFVAWNENSWKTTGMMHKKFQEKHGIVRKIYPYGDIMEATYHHDKQHGLCRTISANLVIIRLYRHGNWVAFLWFDHEFNETKRGGSEQHLLKGFSPLDFKLNS